MLEQWSLDAKWESLPGSLRTGFLFLLPCLPFFQAQPSERGDEFKEDLFTRRQSATRRHPTELIQSRGGKNHSLEFRELAPKKKHQGSGKTPVFLNYTAWPPSSPVQNHHQE